MELFLMRHGHAVYGRDSDSSRPLTPQGVALVEAQAQSLLESLQSIERIFFSPFLRAQQTAEIMSASLGIQAEPSPLLVPDGDLKSVLSLIESHENQVLLLVSHQPLVEKLAGWLVAGQSALPEAVFPGQVISLSAEIWGAGCANLNWSRGRS